MATMGLLTGRLVAFSSVGAANRRYVKDHLAAVSNTRQTARRCGREARKYSKVNEMTLDHEIELSKRGNQAVDAAFVVQLGGT
jgi:hypothetical protein